MKLSQRLRRWGARHVALAAILLGHAAANAQPPCNCDNGFAGAVEDGSGGYLVDEALPPAEILPRSPCVYKRHDIDPCYNLRCDLYPPPPPMWFYVQADVAPLFRDYDNDPVFQRVGEQGPAVLNTGTLEPEFQGALRLLVGGRINELYRIETVFLGLADWNDVDTVRDFDINSLGTEGNLFSPFSNFGDPAFNVDGGVDGVVGLDFNNLAALNIRSSFDSVEMNLLVDIPRIRNLESSVMLGARYIRINEDLGYRTVSNVPAGGSIVEIGNSVNNEMIGLQLGYRARFLVEQRMWLDYEMKGAIFNNAIDHRLRYQQTEAGVLAGAFTDQVDVEKTSFGGELGLVLNYLLTPNLAVRLGYQAMWFTGMGLAAENAIPEGVRITSPAGGPNTLVFAPLEVDHDAEIVYHGPVAGVMMMW